MTKYQKIFVVAGLCVAFATAGVLASPGVQADEVVRTGANNVFTGINQFPSIKIGAEGVGGVTFFNGSIVNATTDDAGNDNPVTFGDNVRIDGMLTRGPDADKPVWIGSGLKVDGGIEGIGVSDVDGLQDDLDGKAGSSDAYTKTESDARYYTQTAADAAFYSRTTADSTFVGQASPNWSEQNGVITVHGSDCKMSLDTEAYRQSNSQLEPRDAADIIYCPLNLPDGATLDSFSINVMDNEATGSFSTALNRVNYEEAVADDQLIFTTGSSDNAGRKIYTDSVPYDAERAVVDNDNYAYYFTLITTIAGGNDFFFSAAQVKYSFTRPY
ncbi:hypothetical protein ACFL2B_00435 [Patescibacteria group bacterium]